MQEPGDPWALADGINACRELFAALQWIESILEEVGLPSPIERAWEEVEEAEVRIIWEEEFLLHGRNYDI